MFFILDETLRRFLKDEPFTPSENDRLLGLGEMFPENEKTGKRVLSEIDPFRALPKDGRVELSYEEAGKVITRQFVVISEKSGLLSPEAILKILGRWDPAMGDGYIVQGVHGAGKFFGREIANAAPPWFLVSHDPDKEFRLLRFTAYEYSPLGEVTEDSERGKPRTLLFERVEVYGSPRPIGECLTCQVTYFSHEKLWQAIREFFCSSLDFLEDGLEPEPFEPDDLLEPFEPNSSEIGSIRRILASQLLRKIAPFEAGWQSH